MASNKRIILITNQINLIILIVFALLSPIVSSSNNSTTTSTTISPPTSHTLNTTETPTTTTLSTTVVTATSSAPTPTPTPTLSSMTTTNHNNDTKQDNKLSTVTNNKMVNHNNNNNSNIKPEIQQHQPTSSITTNNQKNMDRNQKWNKWSINSNGFQNQLPYQLNCSLRWMTIQVNLSTFYTDGNEPYVYLEKLRSFSICRPKIVKQVATFHLSLDDNFYRCGTTKVHDQVTGTRIYYNRVVVESKNQPNEPVRSIYFKCSQPAIDRLLTGLKVVDDDDQDGQGDLDQAESNQTPSIRTKRDSWIHDSSGRLVNFTEIDLPENFMEAEVLDFTDNITASAPYPHLNLKVKRNGRFVNTSLNVAPGTPLEMIIYLDEQSKHVYGLLASFMKVTDNSNRQQEVIVLNGCSIDPYIFGNFETEDNGDSISAKFRAFKFPESNYVMFIGTVNVCLDQCKPVPCGNGIYALGRRRRRRSLPADLPKDPNKVFEIEMMAYLRIGYSDEELAARRQQAAIQADYREPERIEHHSPSSQQQDSSHGANAQPKYESLTSSSPPPISSPITLLSTIWTMFIFLILI